MLQEEPGHIGSLERDPTQTCCNNIFCPIPPGAELAGLPRPAEGNTGCSGPGGSVSSVPR